MPVDQVIEALITEYYKLVFHTIYGLTGNWEESQDLTQETFHQALKGIEAAHAASGAHFHPKAWLLRIALNTVRMQRRRSKLFRFIPFSSLQEKGASAQAEAREQVNEQIQEQAAPLQPAGYGATSPGNVEDLVAEQDVVRRTMAKLPEPLRVCLLLSIVSGLTTAEIADLLQLKEDAVRQRLTRARKQFKQVYAYENDERQTGPAPASAPPQHVQTENQHHPSVGETTQGSLFATHPPAIWRSYG